MLTILFNVQIWITFSEFLEKILGSSSARIQVYLQRRSPVVERSCQNNAEFCIANCTWKFFGRNECAELLVNELLPKNRSQLRVLRGHHGVGKTELVRYVAKELYLTWNVDCVEFSCKDSESLGSSVEKFATKLGIGNISKPEQDKGLTNYVKRIVSELNNVMDPDRKWLLVFEDVNMRMSKLVLEIFHGLKDLRYSSFLATVSGKQPFEFYPSLELNEQSNDEAHRFPPFKTKRQKRQQDSTEKFHQHEPSVVVQDIAAVLTGVEFNRRWLNHEITNLCGIYNEALEKMFTYTIDLDGYRKLTETVQDSWLQKHGYQTTIGILCGALENNGAQLASG
jgi:hypothetical protein